jgi:hypothetical protein
MSKHTKGPWEFKEVAPGHTYRTKRRSWAVGVSDTREGIAYVYGDDEANARLIAAAPDMYASLKEMIGYGVPPVDAPCHYGIVTQDKCSYCQRILRAAAAIQKAEK